MHLASALPALLAGVQLALGAALHNRPVPGGDTCVADDLLRFVRSHRRDATPFCRKLLVQKKVEITVVKGRDAPAPDPFAQSVAGYPPKSLSSACSCLTVPICIKKTTTQTTAAQTTTTEIPIPTYPTRPFRMYSLDAAGSRLYLDRRDWTQGDVVASTPDASLAETFVVDVAQHLFYADGFSTGLPVYAFYGPTYFNDNLAKVVYFNTPVFIATGDFIYHEWTVDLDTLSITLTNPARVLQLCDRVYNSMLMVGNVVDSGCVAVSLFMEYIV